MENKSISGKLSGTLFLLLFAISFSWFGLAYSVPTLFNQVSQWYQARSYVAVPASVQSTELKITREETVTESVKASFVYRYRDLDYVIHKVSASDNIDSYHRTVHERLRQAQTAGEQVTIWIDPAHPEHALYDRAFRWKLAVFMLPFAVLFPAVGLGAWWAIWFVWWGKRDAGRALGPRELRPQSSGGRLAPLAVTLIAFFVSMMSWPATILFVAQTYNGRGEFGFLMLLLLFSLIGLGLAWVAARMWRTRWRIGKPMLELLQTPGGGQYPLRGRIHFTPALGVRLNEAQLMHPVRIVVKLVQSVVSGEDTTESTLWEKCVLETSLARGTGVADFSVELPAGLPPSGTSESTTVEWRLELKTLGADIWFDLPEAGRMAID